MGCVRASGAAGSSRKISQKLRVSSGQQHKKLAKSVNVSFHAAEHSAMATSSMKKQHSEKKFAGILAVLHCC